MTKPEDQPPGSDPAPKPSVPSWVDEVLGAQPTAHSTVQPTPRPVTPPVSTEAAGELHIPEAIRPQPAPTPSPAEGAGDLRIPDPPRPAPTVITATARPHADGDDWIARATGNAAKSPTLPTGPQVTPPPPSGGLSDWPLSRRSAAPSDSSGLPADTAQKKLIAGLLAIVLGSLGVHKFYLGMNTPGVIVLATNVGVWILALLLGLLTLGLGLIVTVPLAGLVSTALGLLGLVEGILYLTKSDADFHREYVLGHKPWL